MVELILPRKEDYPANFEIMEAKGKKKPKLYYASLNASAMAYFGRARIVRAMHIRKLQHAISLIPERRYRRAFDVGTGIGILLPTLSKIAEKVEAIDSSSIISYTKYMVKKRKLTNVAVKKFDANNPKKYPQGYFDLIVCMSTLEHIHNLDEVFQTFKRLLARDGVLIIGFPVETRLAIFIHETYMKFFRGQLKEDYDFKKREVKNPYEKTEGHISNYQDIIITAKKYFNIEQKIGLKPFFINIYCTLKLAHKK